MLEGRPPTETTIANAAKLATDGAKPLPMTGYKLELLNGLVRDLLTQIAA
jgi:xanthine dehydrogenase YagS FAD-binding subunit